MGAARTVGSLGPADLAADPFWEVLAGEDEEPEVRPFRLPRHGRDRYLVAAHATLADGRRCPGFVVVSHHGAAVEVGALTLLESAGQRRIGASDPAFLFALADPSERALLPLSWTLDAALDGEAAPRQGSATASRLINFFKGLAWQSRLQRLQRDHDA